MTGKISSSEVFERVKAGETRLAIAQSVGLSPARIVQLYNAEEERRAMAAKAAAADWRTLRPHEVPGLSGRTGNGLRWQWETMGDVAEAFSGGSLWERVRQGKFPNFGRKSYQELRAWFAERGVKDPEKPAEVVALEVRLQAALEQIAKLQEREAALLRELGK